MSKRYLTLFNGRVLVRSMDIDYSAGEAYGRGILRVRNVVCNEDQ